MQKTRNKICHMDNSDKIIEKIREQKLEPIPRSRFTLRNALIWSAYTLFVLIGAVAFSVILFVVQQMDFDLVAHMSHSLPELLLALTPFFWIIALLTGLVIAMVSMRKTKKGYKFTSPALAGLSVSFSILLGTLFFISGGAGWLENAFALRVSLYEGVQEKKIKVWMAPEEGYLAGTIIEKDNSTVHIIDFDNNTWMIETEGADIPPVVFLEEGETIKLIGKVTGEGAFTAEIVRPWGGGPRFRNQIKKNERN